MKLVAAEVVDRIGRVSFHFFLLVTVFTTAAQDPPHKMYTVADGLSSNTVYCAVQDNEGYMWFGTDAGACRFDGLRFERFTASQGLADNEVIGMHVDQKGRIWFLGLNGRVSVFSDGAFVNERLGTDRIQGRHGLVSAADDGQGGVWVGGFDSELFHWSNGRVARLDLKVPGTIGTHGMVKLLRLSSGTLYAMRNAALFLIESDTARFLRWWDQGGAEYPMAAVRNDRVMAFGRLGLLEVGPEEDRLITPLDRTMPPSGARLPFVDRDGSIWSGREDGGVVRVMEHAGGAPTIQRFFIRSHINTIQQDQEGNIWWCTDGNGVFISRSAQLGIQQFMVSDDVRERSVHSLRVTPSYGVVFGTSYGRIFRIAHGQVEPLTSPGTRATGRDRVRQLEEGPDGRLWITTDSWFGTYDHGRDHTIPMRIQDSTRSDLVVLGMKAFAIGVDGHVVSSFFGLGTVQQGPAGSETRFDKSLWKGSTRIYAPFIDSAGTVWFDSGNRLLSSSNGLVKEFPALDAEFGLRITSITGMEEHTLAIGSAGGGVKLVRNGQVIRRFTTKEGLPSDEVRRVRYEQGTLLVATDHGAAMIHDPLGAAETLLFTLFEGLPSDDVQDVDMDTASLWLATSEGLFAIPLRHTGHGLRPPITRILRVMVADRMISLDKPMRFDLGTRLQVVAHGFAFSMPDAVEYAFRDDADTSWMSSASGVFSITLSEPGAHRLLVRSRLPDTGWSPIVTLDVEVLSPWYLTWWFRGLAGVTLLCMGMVLVRYLARRRLRAHMLRMEREKAQQEERRRIAADMHDDLGADISHLLLLARESAGSGTLDPQDRDNLMAVERYADGMVRKIDEVIWSLAPEDDRLLPTLRFIQRHTEEIAGAHHLAFRTIPINGSDRPYPSMLRRELFLLVKESLANIIKHTDVRTLRFEAVVSEDRFSITIEDDGRPLVSGHPTRNGHGQANMRHRLEKLSGEVRTEPVEPMGTRTIFRVWTGRSPQ
ncbi:MAG TPA: two-component regulator propeller domain-containing protein [Flavobacteriales bacterium]|nr:two-component regulator propeller domain-containing protein [Flavobacteriales bacterium]